MKVDLTKHTLVDASVMRELDGKTVDLVTKDGVFMEFDLVENGEKWKYGWMDGGHLIPGEPCVILATDGKVDLSIGKPVNGHVSRVLKGKRVERVTRSGTAITFWMDNGERWNLGWANPETGEPQRGEPVLVRVDVRIVLPGAKMEINAGGMG